MATRCHAANKCLPIVVFIAIFTFIFVSYPRTSYSSTRVDIFPEPSMLANVPRFAFVINRDVCGSEAVDLLVLIGSHPDHVRIRNVYRQSWATATMDRYVVKLVFLFGRPDNATLQQTLVDESAAHGDVVQGSFRDSYANVSLRDVMGLRWTWRQCPRARFVMRTDDDVCISVDHVLQILEDQTPKDSDYVACLNLWHNAPVLRRGRYGLTRQEHPRDTYQTYCWGTTYWLTPGAAKQLDRAALKHAPYRMNDAYITGTLVAALGWQHVKLDVNWTSNPNHFVHYLKSPDAAAPKYVLGYNGANATLTALVHRRFRQYAIDNGIPRVNPPLRSRTPT